MPFEVELEHGETVAFEDYIQLGKSEPFAFVVTNRALYLPEKKKFAVRDPYTFRKVPISQVVEVTLASVRPYPSLMLAACMIIFGGISSYFMLGSLLSGEETTVSGYPIALLVVGILIPFVAKSRRSLEVKYIGDLFRWKQPILFGASSTKKRYQKALRGILEACRDLGIPTSDETSKMTPNPAAPADQKASLPGR